MATINEDYVSFEIAKLLKEKGFDEVCNRVYEGPNLKYTTLPISPLMSLRELGGFHPKQLYVSNNELGDIVYTAPTLQMVMKWLREVYNIHIVIKIVIRTCGDTKYYYELYSTKNKSLCVVCDIYKGEAWDSNEEATEAAIRYCLNNLI